ncbi:YrzI family small protein [Neobacillus fumarioli]|nr:YrzI family small protein [Neobacillus fumarioli]
MIIITLNIFFLTITIKRRMVSLEEARQQEMVEKLYEQNKDKQISAYRLM